MAEKAKNLDFSPSMAASASAFFDLPAPLASHSLQTWKPRAMHQRPTLAVSKACPTAVHGLSSTVHLLPVVAKFADRATITLWAARLAHLTPQTDQVKMGGVPGFRGQQ
jgi:hypothetical protein